MRDDESSKQRRLEERTECDIEARVELSDSLAIACRIKDITPAAFRIQIVDAIHLPEEFDLLIPMVEGTFNGIALGWLGGREIWRAEKSLILRQRFNQTL